jgi:uncharacterized protein involved in outer membrane biogenesis
MKKIVLRLGIGLIILVVLIVLGISLFLDGMIKRGIEMVGPNLTGVSVKLDRVSLSPLSGSGTVKGLMVGNPEGFKAPHAIRVGSASLALQPGSLLADKIVIRSIRIEGPEITFEYGKGGNNLGRILANVRAASSAGTNAAAKTAGEAPGTKPGKKLEVDELLITGARVNLSLSKLGGQFASVTLPEVHLADLGKGPEGITSAELTARVLDALEKAALQAANSAVTDLGKNAAILTKDLGKSATGAVDNITRSFNDLLKKK